MGILERLALPGRHRDQSLSINDWADYFSFGGNTYPLVQTTMGTVDREQVGFTSVAGFKGSGPIFSLVLARLQVFSQVRFQWTRFAGSQPTELFGTPELGVLERPWRGGTTSDLLARMEVYASVAGCAYVTRPRADRLSLLRPDRVIIVMGSETDAEDPSEAPDAEIIGFVHETSRGRMTFFEPDQVAYYAPIPDPDYRFLGMSWITPVIRDLQADSLATEHKARFFVNSATPNLAIKFDASIAIEKVKQFKELLESEHKGAFNAWKTLYLGGGADPVTVGNSFRDMDYAVIQGRAESRLASAAGVPPSWVGFAEGLSGSSLNAGNFNSARRRFSDGTMIHLWGSAATSLETLLTRPSGASLWYDPRVPFMREDAGDLAAIQQNQAQTIVALVRDGFTPESAVAAVTKNDFNLLVHSGKVSVQLQEPGTDPAGGQVPKDLAADAARSWTPARHKPGTPPQPHNQQDHAGGVAGGLVKKAIGKALTGQDALAAPPLKLADMSDDSRAEALWFRTGDNSDETRDRLPGFVSFNRHMREGGNDPEMDARVADVDSAMRDSVLTQPIEVLRGLEYGSLGEPGTLRGTEFSDKAFASTTTDPDHARAFGTAVMRIRVPAGVSAVRMADRDSDPVESEILLDRDLRYRIVGEEIEKNERGRVKRHLIDVEVVQ